MKKPQNIYDNSVFYNEYKEMREGQINANELIEIPIMKSMLPDLKGKRILDLGCGNGSMSKYFIENGASYVLALDISQNMIDEAKEKNNDKNISYQVLGMEEISSIKDKFDIIFVDPPYASGLEQAVLENLSNLLDEDGVAIYETDKPFSGETFDLRIVDQRRYGKAHLTFFRKGE